MELEMKGFLKLLWRRLWIVVLFVIAFSSLASYYSKQNYSPIYAASTRIIVNSSVDQSQLGQQDINFGAIGVNIALIDTFKEIIKSPSIMDRVAERYPDLRMSTDQLIGSVSVSSLTGTQLMTITARSSSHERAVRIANVVAEVFKTEMPKIMKVQNISILSAAKMQANPTPINAQSNQLILIGFVGGLVTAVGIIFLLDILDDTLKTEEDIRRVFGTSTLAMIPKMKRRDFRSPNKKAKEKKAGEPSYATNQ